MRSIRAILIIVLILFLQAARAQVVIEENPSYTNSTEKPLLDEMLNVDVLEGSTVAAAIAPTGEQLCFDKVFSITMNTRKGPASACLYVNTKIGLIGYSPLKPGNNPGNCDLKAEDPDFSFNIIGLKGNHYGYVNVKKSNGIEKWVSTGNSDAYRYQYSTAEQDQVLFRKDISREYLNGKVKAWGYQSNNRPETWYLFGKNLPEKVVFQPLKYVGNFGIGYQYTDEGLFIILQVEGEVINAIVKEIQDTYVCFDPAPYKKMEDEFYSKGMEGIAKKRLQLNSRRERMKPGECAPLEIRNIQYEEELLNEQEENIRKAAVGNIAQNAVARQAMAQTMYDYESLIQQAIYDTELDICKQEKQLQEALNNQSRSSSGQSSIQRRREKIECLRDQLFNQKQIQQKINRVSEQYSGHPEKQIPEKARLFLKSTGGCG